jgi:cell division protein FtsB
VKFRGRAQFALAALAFVVVLFVFVFPTRSYLAQRGRVGAAQHDLDVLRKQNRELETTARRLQSPSEVQRIARDQFGWAFPGEQLFKVLPAPAPTTTVP